jgi:uncharacterized protein (TIGR03435 family)
MNAIQILSSQPWVERLGWTLVHFLWQGSLIAALYAGARKAVKRIASPNTRYLLACAALALMMAAPLLTWSLVSPSGAVADSAYRLRNVPTAASSVGATDLSPSLRTAASSVEPAQLLSWVVVIWLIGAIAFWVRLAGGWVVAARMRSMLVRPAPPEWQQVLGRLSARIGLSRPVRLLVSALVQVPTVVGWLRPVVLVPVGALSGLPPDHLEALLVHELAHIRRHDYLVNILQSIAEALLFYHPAIWWVSGHIRSERESCCDDVAVSVTGDVLTYVRALAEWESCRPAPFNAVSANGGSLAQRIARLLGQSRPPSRTGLGPGVLAVALLLVVAAFGVFGQQAARPEFQVASIKPNTAVGARGMGVRALPGGRLSALNAPVMMLIQNAYAIQASQVVGGPPWINSDGYDIEAKPESNTDRPHMWLMVQSLLADRFKLALHRETRELPIYALTMTKGGLKPPPPNAGSCVTIDLSAPPPPGTPLGFPCGKVGVMGSPSGLLQMQGGKVPMPELVRVLAMVLGRPVADRTGVTGEFDVHLDFTPDESTLGLPGAGGPGDPGGPPLATDPGRPNIFAALQEQLGLKLSPAKGPVEVLVIDHVERPAAN